MSNRWKTLLAFGVIYFVWGSTYLAIRVGVTSMPPLIFAAIRFVTAGAVLVAWTKARGERWPSAREWRSLWLLGALIFVGDYGLMFWAEQRVASGVSAVLMATIPVFIAIAEIVILRTQRMTVQLGVALGVGLSGVVVLMSRALALGGAPISSEGAAALIVASMFWSVATVIMRKLPLPESKLLSAGVEMLLGGLMLGVVATGFGEPWRFHPAAVPAKAWFAMVYLIVMGSLLGFTAYVWLISRESPTKVGTYAYVNPVVAVAIGYFLGGEHVGSRTVLGTLLVLASVLLITLSRAMTGRGARSGMKAAGAG